ncbi:unnamed protein product [Rangifer tarandus platyrhynchus]|uniref:Uncharacterized protein n=2 Tax=Rangifer tarandus platyrhynchus TaxID=3082113 RepID=A0ABN8ZDF4_RANTA|nr:unnamed protein product [Rangifer tarandus platyrhynchus]
MHLSWRNIYSASEPSLDNIINSPSLPFAHIYSTLNGLICLYFRTAQYDPNIISTHMIIQVWKSGMLVILLTVPHSQGLKHQKTKNTTGKHKRMFPSEKSDGRGRVWMPTTTIQK